MAPLIPFVLSEGFSMSSLMVSVTAFITGVKDRLTSERGATATEYSLLVAFIALVIIVGVTAFGGALNTWFNNIAITVGGWNH
jgi:pilus assembly protein Flp/PilA